MGSDYFPIHAHSEWSVMDGMGSVEEMVSVVDDLGQPALALTDHGNMAGCIRLYKEAQKAGIAPFPGSELYVVKDATTESKNERYHLGMVALDYRGYRAMVRLSSRSHTRERFYRKPLVDFADLAMMHESGDAKHVAVTTGCYFGLVVQALVNKGPKAARGMVEMLARWFPNTYVELQHHGVEHDSVTDDEILSKLVSIADRLGLPVVLGQDSHYCYKHDQPAHNMMKDISYFGDGDDNRFPGGPYHLASTKFLKKRISNKKVWNRIEEGHGDLLLKNRLIIPALDTYKFHVPEISRFADKVLWKRLVKGSWKRGGDLEKIQDKYLSRTKYELDVISKKGMANYFLVIDDIVEWCRSHNVIVQARGSANGSLVCYYLGITDVDPLQWDTDFDRFLSLDREKPPDIDLDIESGRRKYLVEHIKSKYPSAVHIGTYSKIGITEIDSGDGYFEDKGSLFVQYKAAMRRKRPGQTTIPPEHRKQLGRLSELEPRRSLGVHAAGIVLPSKALPVEDLLPLGFVPSSGTTVTQSVMEDVEDAGYVKGDFLGLRQLETLAGCLRNLGKQPDDFSWIPWDDRKTCRLLASGNTVGIFQFEGAATSKGGREMKIRDTMDAIVCMALYRPALMNGGQKDQYLQNRKLDKRDQVRLPGLFDDILEVTYGVPVFQEQVMQICKRVNMSPEDWNRIVKAVKASNDKIEQYAEAIFHEIRPRFIALCIAKGLTKQEAKETWEAVVGFSDYGFNRAHATGYGITAYRSAYLKRHHPVEYMHSLLCVWAGTDKERLYVREARRLGIKIARADVNKSDVLWTLDSTDNGGVLRRGLLSLDGIGETTASTIVECRPEHGWSDMDDFVNTVPARPVTGGKSWAKDGSLNGVMEKLRLSGALSSLGVT